MSHRRLHGVRLGWFKLGLIVAVALGGPVLGGDAAGAGEVVLVDEGEPDAAIVVPNGAGPGSSEREAAELLAAYIERMSGAALAIRQERELDAVGVDDGWIVPGVPGDALLGMENVPGEEPEDYDGPANFLLVGKGELVRDLDVDDGELGPGGVRVVTRGNAVVVLGGPARVEGEPGTDDGGLRYAAIELLEHLGLRHLWPGELGMVVPERATVAVEAIDREYTPQIRRRGIRWGGLRRREQTGLERLGMSPEQWHAGREEAMGEPLPISWRQWQRLGGRMPNFGHAGAGLRDAERHLEENPEWFAKQADGTRDQSGSSRWRLCKSNPELIEHVANDIIQRRNENPDLELVSLDPNDGGGSVGWCQCDECKALDPEDAPTVEILIFPSTERSSATRQRVEHPSLTDRHLHYWNAIAERVTEEHPDLLFGVSAYSAFSHPPLRERVHPNLLVRYVPGSAAHVDAWQEAGMSNVFWRPNILLVNRRDGKLRSIVGRLTREMHAFADAGIVQTDFDHINHHWATLGLSYYATARLVWEPRLTADEIIADFAERGFGEVARFIERYFHAIERLTEQGIASRRFRSAGDRSFTSEVLSELRSLLNAAEHRADDPVIRERIAFLRTGLNFTELHEALAEKTWRDGEGMEVDEALAQRLVDLNALMLRDVIRNHHLATNAANLVWATGTFAHYARIGGRTVAPSDEALLERIDDPSYGLTGREDSLDEMLEAFGL